MIDLKMLLNNDALVTIRDALESHVFYELSDDAYKRSDRCVVHPGSDDPDNQDEIRACCELAAEIDRALKPLPGFESWLTVLCTDFGKDH